MITSILTVLGQSLVPAISATVATMLTQLIAHRFIKKAIIEALKAGAKLTPTEADDALVAEAVEIWSEEPAAAEEKAKEPPTH